MDAFGVSETRAVPAHYLGTKTKVGSLGKASPMYDLDVVDENGNPVPNGTVGELVVHTRGEKQLGMFVGYYEGPEKTEEVWKNGVYHTLDTVWRDDDGFFWYVGRMDDVIKASGYRIGPFEIESVLMELPYILECGVTGAPDPVRGVVVKASIVLTKGTEPSDALVKEIQDYVKKQTAPYKYPRIVEFVDELPKTISGKIRRVELRKTLPEAREAQE